jgi:hypothetical protein
MLGLGIGILFVMVGWLAVRFVQRPKLGRWPWYGVVGLVILLLAEFSLWRKFWFVKLYFTPTAWTGYILLCDAAVVRLTGRSRIRASVPQFCWLALWSFPLWLIFEAYNLHLRNWVYLNLPENIFLRSFGYVWAFATIWPALFETTDLVIALNIFRASSRPTLEEPRRPLLLTSFLVGLLMLLVPLFIPQPQAGYLFGFVWLGMIFAVDPINLWLGNRSLWREWLSGHRDEIFAMLVAGLFCGFLWEFWNYWAFAKWIYVFPLMQRFKIFEMPPAGYLGFPPFCVECFVMFELVKWRWSRIR